MSVPTTVPVSPLTGDPITVRVRDQYTDGGFSETTGCLVTPGLAVTEVTKKDPKFPDRYAITHTISGVSVVPGLCGMHAIEAVRVVMLAPSIDWTLPATGGVLVNAIKAVGSGYLETLTALRRSCDGRWCTGDGPEPKSAEVECFTCGWEWAEGDNGIEFPLTEAEAEDLRDNHECDPDVVITRPGEAREVRKSLAQRDVERALAWAAAEYRRCIVAARCAHDSATYAENNGRAEAYRQLGTHVADAVGLPAPDWNAIKEAVPDDGIYR